MQLQLAGIVAAAAHAGLISVHEGICDVIDASSGLACSPDNAPSEAECLKDHFGQWSRCIAEQYMNPAMPGVNLSASSPARLASL